MVEAYRRRIKEIISLSDRVVAISQWLYDALVLNGVPKSKLVLSHSGGPISSSSAEASVDSSEYLRVGYLGRWDKLKGVDLLVRAVKKLPASVKIELTLHGLAGSEPEENYKRVVEVEAGSDPRIKFAAPVPKGELRGVIQSFDVVAIPSQLLETGPLIALEAHAAKVPVIASDLAGLSERVRDGIDGVLVKANDEEAWTKSLQHLATDRGVLEKLRSGIRPVRTMDAVADDMAQLYRHLTDSSERTNAA